MLLPAVMNRCVSYMTWRSFPLRQEPAVFTSFGVKRLDFGAVLLAKCQFRMERGKHNTSNGVSSHVPSCRAIISYLTSARVYEVNRGSHPRSTGCVSV